MENLYEQFLDAMVRARALYDQIATSVGVQPLPAPAPQIQPAVLPPADPNKRRAPRFTPKHIEYLKKQGRYIALSKNLSPEEKKKLKAFRATHGFEAALAKLESRR